MEGITAGLVCGRGGISGEVENETGRDGGWKETRVAQRWRTAGARRSRRRKTPGGGVGRLGLEPEGFGGIAQKRAGEDSVGLVVASTDDGAVALDKSGTGDGALHAGNAGRQPAEAKAWQEIGKTETPAPANGEKKCIKSKNVTFLGLTPSRELERRITEVTGRTKPKNWVAHHDLNFATGGNDPSLMNLQLNFLKRGLDCNDAAIGGLAGRFVPADFSQKVLHYTTKAMPRSAWNFQWEHFFVDNPTATSQDIIAFMKQLQEVTSQAITKNWTDLNPYDIAWPYPIQ